MSGRLVELWLPRQGIPVSLVWVSHRIFLWSATYRSCFFLSKPQSHIYRCLDGELLLVFCWWYCLWIPLLIFPVLVILDITWSRICAIAAVFLPITLASQEEVAYILIGITWAAWFIFPRKCSSFSVVTFFLWECWSCPLNRLYIFTLVVVFPGVFYPEYTLVSLLSQLSGLLPLVFIQRVQHLFSLAIVIIWGGIWHV